jgi:lysophospholipase L1-like esterase
MAWGMKNITLCLFGSSIMEGRIGADKASERWYNILQAKLSERFPAICFPVHNAAVGGESTRECMARFDRDVLSVNPDFCLVMFGANNNDMSRPERVLKPGEFEAHMADYLQRIPSKIRNVGVILNPVINEFHFVTKHPAWEEMRNNYGGLNEYLELERESFRSFIKANDWFMLDLYKLIEHDPKKYILHMDGIHLSKAGHELFALKMFELLERAIQDKEYDKK